MLLLAVGAAAQTARRTVPPASEKAFYAESEAALSASFFGTVRVRADSVEVLVSDGKVGRYRVRVGEREPAWTQVSVRARLVSGSTGPFSEAARSDSVVLVASIAPGEEHSIRPLRLVVPRPRGPLDGHGLLFELSALDSATHSGLRPEFFVYACSRYGALVVPRTRAESFRTCRGQGAGEQQAGSSPGPSPAAPVRQVCVEDSASPSGLRPSDLVASRLGGDSVVTRSGERRFLYEIHPRVVGYVSGPQGLEPASVDTRTRQQPGSVTILGHRYERFGPPRAIQPSLLARIGEADGVSVFIPRGSEVLRQPDSLYVLLPDCTFQPYLSPENLR